MKKILLQTVFLLSIFSKSEAQKVENQKITWLTLQWTHQFSEKNRLVFDGGSRDFLPDFQHQTFHLRAKFQHILGKSWDAMPGFALFWSSRSRPTAAPLAVPELRPSLEFNHRQRLLKNLELHHRYMTEARFFRKTTNGSLADGYRFNWRFRYRFGVDFDLEKLKIKGKPLRIRVFDEILLNAREQIEHRFFDQNRVCAGVILPFAKWFSLDLNFMDIFQQQSNGVDFFDRDYFRVGFLFQTR